MSHGGLSRSRIDSDRAETEVMAAVARDVPGAFERLVALYQKRVYHVMTQLVGSSQEAEDLTQELFLKVFRARKTYRIDARVSTWIFAIAHNLAMNHLRSRIRSRVRPAAGRNDASNETTLGYAAAEASREGTPSARMRTRELAEIVQQALATLGEDQRMAILLNKFEEMSYAEIAQVMGRSESAVKSLLTRARENLKLQLESYAKIGENDPPADPQSAESSPDD
jgi:RNA polymerase sigma-70 factor (ECF subfamily)